MRLVIGVERGAEGRLGEVEGAEQVIRLEFVPHEEQVAGEAEECVDRPAVGTEHGRDGMEALEDERMRVDQDDTAGGITGSHGRTLERTAGEPKAVTWSSVKRASGSKVYWWIVPFWSRYLWSSARAS